MSIKFCRSKISEINNSRRNKANINENTKQEIKVELPSEESYTYVLNEAKSGNEMAAVQIDEWSRFGKPQNSKELCIFFKIKKAYHDMFE